MEVTGFLFDKQKAKYFDKAVDTVIDVSHMSIKEKEQWLETIPQDFKKDNDLLIVMYLFWNELRQDLLKCGYLGKTVTKDEQISLDDIST